MTPEEYISRDGTALADLARKGEVETRELIAVARQLTELLNPHINAIIESFPQPLVANNDPAAPFYGVPFLIKDLALHAEGVSYEMGSRLAAGLRTPTDTDLMGRFRAAGLRTIGRCSTPEFGYCPTTEPLVNGPTRNPWNLQHSPGGSSGATAASVAAGIVPLAHANDGGGSIRIPASCCGLVGLKPTRGRVPNGPDDAEPLSGLAVELAVTRTVRDTAALLDAVQGPVAGDPFQIPQPDIAYTEVIQNDPRPLKIACMTNPWSGIEVDQAIRDTIPKTAGLCEEFGHHVEEAAPGIDWEVFLDATHTIWIANIAFYIDMTAAMSGNPVDDKHLEATTLACYEAGKQVSATKMLHARSLANQMCRITPAFFQQYDLLLTPTLSQPPVPIGAINANDASLDAFGWTTFLFDYCPYTPLFNMTGQPAISLPLHSSSNGLPIGVQFAGRYGDEAILLQLARQFETAAPWPLTAPIINDLTV